MPYFYIKTFLLFCLLTYSLRCEAEKVPGYIITRDADTLVGEIRVNHINLYSRGSFYAMVEFRVGDEKKFQTYTPDDILGFAFFHDTNKYIFKQFEIEFTSIIKSDRSRKRFLNMVYKGELSLYRDIYQNTDMQTPSNMVKHYWLTYNYYLYNDSVGIRRVEPSDSIKTVKELLIEYNVHSEFLNQLSERIRFKDIVTILEAYDAWLDDRSFKIKNI